VGARSRSRRATSFHRRLARALVTTLALAAPCALSPSAHAEPAQGKEPSEPPRLGVTSADGRFSAALGGFLQVRGAGELDGGLRAEASLGVPRTRLYAFGHVLSRGVRYRLMLGTPPDALALELYDAYVDVRLAEAVRLRAGRFKVPVSREWVESARLLASVERSSAVRAALPGRDVGLSLSGEAARGALEGTLAVFGGAGDRATRDGNQAPSVAARLVWNTMGRPLEGEVDFEGAPPTLSLGASASATLPSARVTSKEPSAEPRREHLVGVELAFRARGLDVGAELLARLGEPGASDDTVGGYVRADYYLAPLRATVGARAVRTVGLRDPTRTTTELELDLGYYPFRHELKVQGELSLARHHDRGELSPGVMAQAQLAF
jgi:hypothetical protein